jgi:hypothetical protein
MKVKLKIKIKIKDSTRSMILFLISFNSVCNNLIMTLFLFGFARILDSETCIGKRTGSIMQNEVEGDREKGD